MFLLRISYVAMKDLCFVDMSNLTDASVPFLVDVSKKSCLSKINVYNKAVSNVNIREIEELFMTSSKKREISIKSSI